MLIDIHAHLWLDRYEENKRDILRACSIYNISKIYVSALGNLSPDAKEIDELNCEVYKFMKEEPEKVGGFCYVNPNLHNSLDVLKRGIEEQGMSGMKLWVSTYCDDEKSISFSRKMYRL